MRSPSSPGSPPSASLTDRNSSVSRGDGDATWDSDGHLLVAFSPPETPPPRRTTDGPRSFLTGKSRALVDRLSVRPIQERSLSSPRSHEASPRPVRRSKVQSKEFIRRQQEFNARRRAPPAAAPKTPTPPSSFRSFLDRKRKRRRRRAERTAPPDPECSFSPHHPAVAAKVPQAPPIFTDQRAEMISTAAKRSRQKIESEVMAPCTFHPELAESSQKAIDGAESRRDAILRKANEKKQKVYDDITSAREKAEKEDEEERRASRSLKALPRRPAWLEASGKLMTNFYKRNARQSAEHGEPEQGDADVDPNPDANDDE